jgi:phage repressor protein C with HTH and peptisase S24 domain
MKTNDETRRLNLLLAIPMSADAKGAGTQAKLAGRIGTAPAYLSQIKNKTPDSKSGTPKAMGDDMARRIEEALNLPTGWMDTEHCAEWASTGLTDVAADGVGKERSIEEVRRLLPGAMPVRVVDNDDPALTHIPKVKLRLSAGIAGFETEPERFDGSTTAVPTDWIHRNSYNREQLIAIRVKGESMEPTLYEDDLVVVNLADIRPVDGGVYAINYEGEPVVKRLTRDAGQWWLTSDHLDQRKYYRRVCNGKDCIIVGRVVRRESERL